MRLAAALALSAGLLAAHPGSRAEWWYYTGHLAAPSGHRYGFELTFFRLALEDGGDLDAAHFALTDVDAGSFSFAEKLHRPFPGIAGCDPERLAVFNESWEARETAGTHRLSARMPGVQLDLRLEAAAPLVENGPDGISRKGPGPGEYSHYVSIPRLEARGSLVRGGATEAVSGTAWFDHEWGPGGYPKDLAGWDWFSVQLSDGSNLMLYRLRRTDGSVSPFSSGTFVDRSGEPVHLARRDFETAPLGSWRSPHSGAVYPSGWSIRLPRFGLELSVAPLVRDQELRTPKSTRVTYWEGACSVSGTRGGRPVTGRAYAELTGYAGRPGPRAPRPDGATARPERRKEP